MGLTAVTSQSLKDLKSPWAQFVQGDLNSSLKKPSPPEYAGVGDLVFVSTKEQLELALKAKASAIVALEKIKEEFAKVPSNVALFSTKQIQGAMADLLPLFEKLERNFPKDSQNTQIHPTAKVHTSARIGSFTYIGENAVIGANVLISTHCHIGADSKIGDGTHIFSHVHIAPETEIGKDCFIHAGAILGSDGFGFFRKPDGSYQKIPQVGKVILEDNVRIGAGSKVDRATLFESRIKSGTKFDDDCHVAHNCVIGKNSVFAAGFGVAGSSTLGDGVMTGGHVVIGDHVNVGNNVVFGGRTAVHSDILEPGAYTGHPVQKMKDGLRTISSLPELPRMRKQLSLIIKKLGITED